MFDLYLHCLCHLNFCWLLSRSLAANSNTLFGFTEVLDCIVLILIPMFQCKWERAISFDLFGPLHALIRMLGRDWNGLLKGSRLEWSGVYYC